MFLVDINVWVGLALAEHPLHRPARRWFDALSDNERVIFCRATQQGLLRLLTNPAVFAPYGSPPLTNELAWATWEYFLRDPRVAMLPEPEGLEPQWKLFSSQKTASHKLWMDAYLAAFAVAGNYGFVTADAGFRHYFGLNAVILTSA